MRKSRFTENEMVRAVKQFENGMSSDAICRELGISRMTLYKWKSKYSGMEASHVRRLKELEEENRKLKQMYANIALDNQILKEVIEKKTLKPEARKEVAEELEEAIRAAAEFGDGFDKIYQRLKKAGYIWNHKKVYRVYRKMLFNKRTRLKKRLPQRVKVPLETPEKTNDTWSMDFVSDKTESGRTFRVLNVLDDCNREAVAQEAYMSITAERVIRILEEAISCNGKSDCIRTDNGPEFISEKLKIWCLANGVEHKFTQPGKPTQNSYIERFNGSYRRAILDAYIFRNLDEVREITERWRHDYNYNRPHEALGNMTPIEYKQKILNKNTNFDVNLITV